MGGVLTTLAHVQLSVVEKQLLDGKSCFSEKEAQHTRRKHGKTCVEDQSSSCTLRVHLWFQN